MLDLTNLHKRGTGECKMTSKEELQKAVRTIKDHCISMSDNEKDCRYCVLYHMCKMRQSPMFWPDELREVE